MVRKHTTLIAFVMGLAALLLGCSSGSEGSEGEHSGEHSERRGEHDRESSEHDGGEHAREGEESGAELAREETYDTVRNGVRLILTFDAASNCFAGTIENVTDRPLERVRVEVHLSNGRELGPTEPVALAAGAKGLVQLPAESADFERWSAHPEVGSGEHGGEEGEAGREHD